MKIFIPLLLLMFNVNIAAEAAQTITEDPNNVCPIKVGQSLPSLILQDVEGKPFDLNKAVAKQPTVLIFYRGSWCPYCNTHLGELKTIEGDLKKLGYQLLALSPDLPKNLKQSVKQHEMAYELVSDNQAKAAKALGLAFHVDDKLNDVYQGYNIDLNKASGQSHRLLPVPAAIVLDTSGTVKFVFFAPDYKVRISPRVLLAAAEAALPVDAQ
ncbi:Putative peroxiredoxin bcp [Thalassocella blandensis]|nr:Putative peroxiredoxin bcp [Thalassocella blandensis]